MTDEKRTDDGGRPFERQARPHCSHCHFPLPASDGGLRHYGTHTAHQEHECLRLLRADAERLRAVLAELVELRDLGAAVEGARKNTFIGTRIHTPASEALFEEFLRRQHSAWNEARDALRPNV